MTSFEDGGFGRWGVGHLKGWTIQRASNDFRAAPAYDHTTGGEYNFIENIKSFHNCIFSASSGQFMFANSPAEINSPPLYANPGCQLGFYVFKNTRQSSLVVSLRNLNTGGQQMRRNIQYLSANWVAYQLSLDHIFNASVPVQVVFSAPFSTASNSATTAFGTPYIAVDDIFFTSECTILSRVPTPATLPNHSPQTTAKPTNCLTLSCTGPNGTQICVPSENLCDFVSQCKSGEDERNCFGCDFDGRSLCGWSSQVDGSTNDASQQFWVVVRLAGFSQAALPKSDADGKGTGGFISVYASDSASNTRK